MASHKNQLIAYANCIKPAFDYFNRKFGSDLENVVSAFKYLTPIKVALCLVQVIY